MVLLGGVYHVVLWGIGRVVFPSQAEGSLIRRADGTIVGSRLIAQKFTRPEYFQPRPSAVDYNAASTGGSNYGPSNPDHLKAVQERLDAIVEAGRRAGQPGAVGDGDGQRRRPGSAHSAGRRGAAGGARGRAPASVHVERVRELIARAHRAADVRVPRPRPRQRARAESRARRGVRDAGAARRSPAATSTQVDARMAERADARSRSGTRASSGRRSSTRSGSSIRGSRSRTR